MRHKNEFPGLEACPNCGAPAEFKPQYHQKQKKISPRKYACKYLLNFIYRNQKLYPEQFGSMNKITCV
jgi:hypothetical protein